MGYNLLANRRFLFPVLVSYERAVSPRWSIGAEALVNGGYPDERRKGASLLIRYYVLPSKAGSAPLAGVYGSLVGGCLVLDLKDEPPPVAFHARRLKTGVLVGWQKGLSKPNAPRFVLDVAAGAMHWSALGSDRVEQGPNKNGLRFGVLDPGIRFDVRGGFGYQF